MTRREDFLCNMTVAGLLLGTAIACGTIPTSDDLQVRIALGVGATMAWLWLVPNSFRDDFDWLIGLLPLVFIVAGVSPWRATLFDGFLHPFIFLFIVGLLAVPLLEENGGNLLVRCVMERWRFGSTGAIRTLGVLTALLSMCMSNTATAAFMIPIGDAVVRPFGNTRVRLAMRLTIAYAATIGGLATPMGTPPNATAVRVLGAHGVTVTFAEWMTMCVPLTCVLLVVMDVIVRRVVQYPALRASEASTIVPWSAVRPYLPRLIVTLFLFFGLISTWILFEQKEWKAWQPFFWCFVAAYIVVVLFPWRRDSAGRRRKGLLPFKSVASTAFLKKCSVLLVLGGGLALGKGMQDAGADHWMGEVLVPVLAPLPSSVLPFVLAPAIAFVGEFLSNTAFAAIILPMFAKIAEGLGIALKPFGMKLGTFCSHGYMLKAATPPNALGAMDLPPEEEREYVRLLRQCGWRLDLVASTVNAAMIR